MIFKEDMVSIHMVTNFGLDTGINTGVARYH